MATTRTVHLIVIGIAWLLVVLSPRRRRALARKLADARSFVSRRIVDRDARASSQAVETWEGEGGAMRAGTYDRA